MVTTSLIGASSAMPADRWRLEYPSVEVFSIIQEWVHLAQLVVRAVYHARTHV